MNAKELTFTVLDSLGEGQTFSGYELMGTVNHQLGERHYPDTMLRYMREYRRKTGRKIVNIDKKKSLYRVEA